MPLTGEEIMCVFDLHCDTLFKSVNENKPLNADDYEFRFTDFNKSKKWFQCMAVWTPDDFAYDGSLINYFINSCERLISESERLNVKVNDKTADKSFIITVENSSILEDKIENIKYLKKYGVKIATLTWNGSNLIGDGALTEKPKGATTFGKKVIDEYIKEGIAIDTSHTSDALFYDIASRKPKKILATHSNSRSVCNNKRNLTDEQFCYIRDNKGVVGLNFHKYFLKENGDASVKDILNHAYHFLSLGGEDTLAIGSDFDGAEMPTDLATSGDLAKLYNSFIENKFPKSIVDKIFFHNAKNFYDNL